MTAEAISIDSRELVFTRTFNAPRRLVWEAWTDPKHIAAWWGPEGFKATVERVDLKVGGTFRLHLKGPDGRIWPCKGIYREIKEPELLVLHGEAEDEHTCGAGLPPRAIVTITFAEDGKRTKLTFHTRLETAADREAAIAMGFREGWAASFNHLEAHLASLA